MTTKGTGVAVRRANSRKRSAPNSATPPLPSPTPPLGSPPIDATIGMPITGTNAVSSPVALQRLIKPTVGAPATPTANGNRGALSATAARNVPAFLNKLYNMVNDPSTDDLIHWGPDGTTFIVQRHEDFAKDVLPRFFKHNNFASFVRQLNMYGFHKIPHLQQGVLHNDGEPEIWEFSNPNFQRNQPDLLCLVTRKKGRENAEDKDGSSLDVNYIIQEIAAIKRHQLTISSDLKNIQRENQVLWGESVSIRDRYQRQQETIEKILRFLASVFSSRKKPLMNKKRKLLLGSTPGGVEDSTEDVRTENVNQRVRELMQPPSISSLNPNLMQGAITLLSPDSSIVNNPITPDFSQQLVAQNQHLTNLSQATDSVSDDIDLLQDHLHSISSLVGLDPGLEDLGDYDVSEFLGQDPSVDGTEEDRQILLALMRHHNPPSPTASSSHGYLDPLTTPASLPNGASVPALPSTHGLVHIPSIGDPSLPSSVVPAAIHASSLGTQSLSQAAGMLSDPHSLLTGTSMDANGLLTTAPVDPTLLPPLNMDDLQDSLLGDYEGNLDDLVLPEMDGTDFDFLNDHSTTL
ncbi:hypothetical protein SpCBS45565_g04694 [Spizellomyces sp. 'palustris']|nr:hypothetical protein SpCBS45565_g04694 [Spizellomyces sp. 'palustris']